MNDVRSKGPSRRRPRALPVFAAGLILLAAGPAVALAHDLPFAPRVGWAHAAAGNESATVQLTDAARFSPRALTVPSNSTLQLLLVNNGSQPHTFTLVALNQSGVVLNLSWTPAQLDAYFASNGSQANISVAPGTNSTINLTYAASNLTRSFEFVSVDPYQFQAGMYGFLNVTSSGPAQVLQTNTTNNFQFIPALLAATPPARGAPTTVDVQITNLGAVTHTFTVVSQSNVTISSETYFSKNAPLINVTINSNVATWANFTVPGPGVYEFACTVSGHFESGMYGFLYVGVPVPAPPPVPSTAIVEVGVLLGALVLLGLGVLLVVAAGFVGRFQPPPPTEEHHR